MSNQRRYRERVAAGLVVGGLIRAVSSCGRCRRATVISPASKPPTYGPGSRAWPGTHELIVENSTLVRTVAWKAGQVHGHLAGL